MRFSPFCFTLLFFSLVFTPISWGRSERLTIGTYNVHNLEEEKALVKDLDALSFIDVIGVQEVMFEGTKVQGDFFRTLRKNRPFVVAVPVSLKDIASNLWEGHAIASKFPIESVGLIPLDPALEQKRAALYAIINVHGTRILFVNTDHDIDHLKVGYWERKKNVTSLLKGIDRIEFQGPSIIVGDFNTADSYQNWIHGISGRDEVILTQKDLLSEGWLTPKPLESEAYTFASYGLHQQLDHLFMKGVEQTSRWQRYQNRQGSDHYPIFAEILLRQ